MCTQHPGRPRVALRLLSSFVARCGVGGPGVSPVGRSEGVVHKIEAASERIEITANTSRVLTLDHKIPRAQVNNPELLKLTPLSPNQIQISAIKPGVTQVNLWDDRGQVYSIDVIIYGDVKELEMALKMQFPNSSVRVYSYSNSLFLTGFMDSPEAVSRIVQLAEDYSPKVINNISVGGVQQVLLHVRVMEVSRTKIRNLGFDFASFSGGGSLISSISGLAASTEGGAIVGVHPPATMSFALLDGGSTFLGLLEAFRENRLLKILSEPTLVAVSGRTASFHVGGEFPILVPQSLGTVSIEYKKYGTQIDFIPIVLGSGSLRLEVRSLVSDIDPARSRKLNDETVPALRVREVNTGVEMRAGQTLALAGLMESRIEAQSRGVPILADLPWVGAGFRANKEVNNEVELLILVRPEFVAALDPDQVPACGPGEATTSPNDAEFYFRGYMEVPRCCPEGKCGKCDRCRNGNGNSIAPFGPEMPLEGAPGEVIQPVPTSGHPAGSGVPVSLPASSRRQGAVPAKGSAGSGLMQPEAVRGSTNARQRVPVTPPMVIEGGDSDPELIGPIGYDVQ
jgi:pilus assembly protein CpaC